MRPARIITAVAFAAAVAVTGCTSSSSATSPSAASRPPVTTPAAGPAPITRPQPGPGPATPPSTGTSSGGRSGGRCAASVLTGSVQGSDGAAGTIWITVRLRNTSAGTCTVKGIPEVRLLGGQGQPVTAPSVPDGPAGSLVTLRPGQAASFTFSEPNACDSAVVGSRLRVTLPSGQGALTVPLGGVTRFGTCASVRVRALQPPVPGTTASPAGRISDPQVAADRLVAAWVGGDRTAARALAGRAVTDRLFSQSPPANTPASLPCRPVAGRALFVCSYPVAERAELSVFVEGGASAGYGVTGIEFGD